MQTRGSTNKSPIKLSMQRKLNDTVICLRMGKTYTAKTPPGDFKVTTPEIPLLSQQAVTSKGIPSTLPTYSWTLTPIPNWTCSVVTISPFNARLPSTWLTNCADPSTRLQSPTREEDVGCKVLHFINNEDQEALGYKTLRRKDAVASFRENKALVTFCICSPCILLCDGL